jgi:hypothetical protein
LLVPDATSAATLATLLGNARTESPGGFAGYPAGRTKALIGCGFAEPTGRPSIGSVFTDAQWERSISTCWYRCGSTGGRSGDQVGGQSETTVCKTVSASPVTRGVIGSPPGTIKEDLRARVAWQESLNPPR